MPIDPSLIDVEGLKQAATDAIDYVNETQQNRELI